jgi:predicted TIM-barrel fold metal-dependent hydrolase
MRIIDLHCYPGTQTWIDAQGPYVEALATYWKRSWSAKSEAEVIREFTEAGVESCLVALDLETTVATPACTNDYVHAMWQRHPDRIIQCWGTLDPFKGELAMREARKAVQQLGFVGFHFHPIMQHFAVNDRRFYPLFELIDELKAAVMIDVGTTGMGAGMPGGMGARIRHAHPSAIDDLAADFPNLKILMAHPGWPWVDETTAVALHKGNVYWEMSGWAPKHFPTSLKIDMRARLQDKVMFGSDYPSMPYARILKEWAELGYSDAVMEKILHRNAERVLGM